MCIRDRKISESNTNYGNNLIVWDIIFGTFFLPKRREVGEIGLLNQDYPEGYIGQVVAPFKGEMDKPSDYYAQPDKYRKYE